MGLRAHCRLGAFFFPRASLFSAFLRTLALSSRAFVFVIVIFGLAVHFHVLPRAGPAGAGSAPRSPRCSWLLCEPRAAAGGCMSVVRGGAHFFPKLISWVFSICRGCARGEGGIVRAQAAWKRILYPKRIPDPVPDDSYKMYLASSEKNHCYIRFR